jgi:hypothetical protein
MTDREDFGGFFGSAEELAQAEAQRQQQAPNGAADDASGWPDPDLGVVNLRRREPPEFPLNVLGGWGRWVEEAARAASCPPDYVVAPLLASASALVGNARWAQATPGWKEPPHLWLCPFGDSGEGKSPGSDCLMRDVLPEIERRMVGDFDLRLEDWRTAVTLDHIAEKEWEAEAKASKKNRTAVPDRLGATVSDVEPQRPRLRQYDVTIEQVAAILATSAPKGLVIIRDEIAGWLLSMTAYNPAGRQFWIESYGGREYIVERRKHATQPIKITHHAVALCGGTQPDKLAELIAGADDGLFARIQWLWPNPVDFNLGVETPRAAWAIEALDRLRQLEMQPGDPPSPIYVPLDNNGQRLLLQFGKDMQAQRRDAGGLFRSAYGKARGTALRLSLVLEELWWCARDGFDAPPNNISAAAFAAAALTVSEYFMPMAERVYGDAASGETERLAAILARWILAKHPEEIHVRELQRNVRLPGLRNSKQIKLAADALVEADWLRDPPRGFGAQSKIVYSINPKLWSR